MDQPEDDATQPVYVPDTGDLISPTELDPPAPPVTDPDDPSYVEPAHVAVRVNPAHLLPPPPPPEAGLGAHLLRDQQLPASHATAFPDTSGATSAGGWCSCGGATPPPDLPPVGTSLPQAPDDDPERSPEGHA